MRENWFFATVSSVIVVLVIIVMGFYIKAQVEVHRDCKDGAVVKNTFDWPVCVH